MISTTIADKDGMRTTFKPEEFKIICPDCGSEDCYVAKINIWMRFSCEDCKVEEEGF